MNNNQYRKGAENLPLREVNTSSPIYVMVVNLENDEIVQEYRMDYAKIEDRKHLGRLTFWAISNKHSIETMALKDAEPELNK